MSGTILNSLEVLDHLTLSETMELGLLFPVFVSGETEALRG